MSASNMPLSPAPSNNGDLLQHGLHHIAQHNANSPYPQEKYQNDEGVHLHGSPAPGYDNVHHGQPARYAYQQHQRQDSGLGIHYVSG
jgi:hypothetical protein